MYSFLRLATVVVVSLIQQNDAFGSTLPAEIQFPASVQGGISEEQFNEAIDLVERFYAPIIAQHGGQFLTFRYWDSDTVSARAPRNGDIWGLEVDGGIARRPEMTFDSFVLVLCHEIGHHLGGFPQYPTHIDSEAANEGQADYFSTQSCVKELWRYDEVGNANAINSVDDIARNLCDAAWTSDPQRMLCYRAMNASFAFTKMLEARFPLPLPPISFSTPDQSAVEHTRYYHSFEQCRLDTLVAGSLCQRIFPLDTIPRTEASSSEVTCTDVTTGIRNVRPRCWFKPWDMVIEHF